MVMKRLDIRIFHGKIEVYPKVGDMNVSYKDNIAYITTGSWYIEVRRTVTIIKCSSKAMVKRRNFRIRTIQGSLFLYNSTNDWHWNFRKKKLQHQLDMLQIDRMVYLNEPYYETETVMKKENNKFIPCEIEGVYTLQYRSDAMDLNIKKDHIKIQDYAVIPVKFTFEKYLLLRTTPNHHVIYLHHCKMKDIFEELTSAIQTDGFETKPLKEIEAQ